MMKKILLFAGCLLLLAGCSNHKTDAEYEKDLADLQNGFAGMLSNGNTNSYTKVNLVEATDFSDGIAWVYTEDDEIGIMDTNGIITYIPEISEIGKFGKDFSGGYSYKNYTDRTNEAETHERFLIINDSGEVTDFQLEGDSKILAGGDGLFLVKNTISNAFVNETRYGVMDDKGEWILEPSADTLLNEQSNWYRTDPIYVYMGEGVFGFQEWAADIQKYVSVLYNAYDKQLYGPFNYTICGYETNGIGEIIEVIPYKFYNGLSVVGGERIGFIDTKGNVVSNCVENTKDIFFKASNGYVFCGKYNYSDGEYEDSKVYNTKGEIVLDLSKYNFLPCDRYDDSFEFIDDTASVILRGVDGKAYVGMINLNGEFLFDPVCVPYGGYSDSPVGFFDGEAVVALAKGNIDGAGTIMPIILRKDGSTDVLEAKSLTKYDNVGFRNGYLLCEDADSEHVFFINHDGDILETRK